MQVRCDGSFTGRGSGRGELDWTAGASAAAGGEERSLCSIVAKAKSHGALEREARVEMQWLCWLAGPRAGDDGGAAASGGRRGWGRSSHGG